MVSFRGHQTTKCVGGSFLGAGCESRAAETKQTLDWHPDVSPRVNMWHRAHTALLTELQTVQVISSVTGQVINNKQLHKQLILSCFGCTAVKHCVDCLEDASWRFAYVRPQRSAAVAVAWRYNR